VSWCIVDIFNAVLALVVIVRGAGQQLVVTGCSLLIIGSIIEMRGTPGGL
jgi:hypothetical protein